MSSKTTITPRVFPVDGGPPPFDSGMIKLLRWAVKNPPADPTVSFAGKIVLVTGANTGLGFQAALKYAALGAERLILGVRTVEKGEAAKQSILQQCAGRDAASISVMRVDLSDYASVQAFAKALDGTIPRLDVALLSAGLANPNYRKTAAGWEESIHVNVLSTALLAILLLPLVRRSSAVTGEPAHMTFNNSLGHAMIKRQWIEGWPTLLASANDERTWGLEKSYMVVKLLGMAVMLALTRATDPREVVVNATCVSICTTDMGRDFSFLFKAMTRVQHYFFARTAEEGSRTLVSGTALSKESHGKFWTHDVLYPMGKEAMDEEYMKKVWDEIMEVLLKVQNDLPRILNGE